MEACNSRPFEQGIATFWVLLHPVYWAMKHATVDPLNRGLRLDGIVTDLGVRDGIAHAMQ